MILQIFPHALFLRLKLPHPAGQPRNLQARLSQQFQHWKNVFISYCAEWHFLDAVRNAERVNWTVI
jgi:hypothetical protein